MKRNLSETFYRTLQWRNSVVVFFFFKDNSMYILYGSNRPVKHSTLFLPLFRTPPTTESILTDMKESQQRLRKERARDPIQFCFFCQGVKGTLAGESNRGAAQRRTPLYLSPRIADSMHINTAMWKRRGQEILPRVRDANGRGSNGYRSQSKDR